MSVSIRVNGASEFAAKLRDQGLLGAAWREALTRSVFIIETAAKKRAPVDRGRLRSSITHEVDPAPLPGWGRVGTDVAYAPFMEYGTGRNSDGPTPGGRHMPPPLALEEWAARKGLGPGAGFAIAIAIARAGGLKPRRFLRGALEENHDRVEKAFIGALKRYVKSLEV